MRLTRRALTLVEGWARWFETRQGPGHVPVIMWQVTDSSNPDFIPQLTVGFEKRDVVDRSRVMECDGRPVEVYQYGPDELFAPDNRKRVDARDGGLVIADDDACAG
ncbi:MAG: hypothetical protein ACOY4R_29280 [Pseudomonadota bacterium]